MSAGPAAVSAGRGGPGPAKASRRVAAGSGPGLAHRTLTEERGRGAVRAAPGEGPRGIFEAAAVLMPLPAEGVPARIAGSKGNAASADFSPFFKSTPF